MRLRILVEEELTAHYTQCRVDALNTARDMGA